MKSRQEEARNFNLNPRRENDGLLLRKVLDAVASLAISGERHQVVAIGAAASANKITLYISENDGLSRKTSAHIEEMWKTLQSIATEVEAAKLKDVDTERKASPIRSYGPNHIVSKLNTVCH